MTYLVGNDCGTCVGSLPFAARGMADDRQTSLLIAKIEQLANETDQVEPTQQVLTTAMRVLRVHTLRAADALQLAAALVLTEHNPAGDGICISRQAPSGGRNTRRICGAAGIVGVSCRS